MTCDIDEQLPAQLTRKKIEPESPLKEEKLRYILT